MTCYTSNYHDNNKALLSKNKKQLHYHAYANPNQNLTTNAFISPNLNAPLGICKLYTVQRNLPS